MHSLRSAPLALSVEDYNGMRKLRFVALAVAVAGDGFHRIRNLRLLALVDAVENCNRMCKLRLVALALAVEEDCNRIHMDRFLS